MLNHANQLQTWINEIKQEETTPGSVTPGIYSATVSLRTLNETIDYDADDIWDRFRVRDSFAAIWRGSISLQGDHSFDFGGSGFRRLYFKGVHGGFKYTMNTDDACTTVGTTYGCGGTTFPDDIYEVTLVYITIASAPSIKLKFWGLSTGGSERLVWQPASNTGWQVDATMTGSGCSTMSCRAGLEKKHSASDLLCKDVPCHNEVDTPTCCANQYQAIVAGEFFTCGLTLPERRPLCWGASSKGTNEEWKQHPGPFIDFSIRGEYLCGVLDAQVNGNNPNQIDCFKPNTHLAPEVEYNADDQYASVSVGISHTCGLRDTFFAACTGKYPLADFQAIPMDVQYSRIVAGDNFTCALSKATGSYLGGHAYCWGKISTLQAFPPGSDPARYSTLAEYMSLEAGRDHACGIYKNGTAVCWGRNTNNQAVAPSGVFTQVAPGVNHTCGLKVDESVVCWGSNAFKESEPPTQEKFLSVSCGWHHSCGIRKHDKEVVCWGSNWMDGTDGTPIWTGQSEPPMAENTFP